MIYDESLPDQFTWQDVDGINYVTPVQDQQSCGSCVAFGTISALEAVIQIEIGQDLDIDLDITNTQDRNLPLMRQQLREFIEGIVLPLSPLLAAEGKKFNAFRFIKKAAETFESITNGEEFFDNVAPQEAAPVEGGVPETPIPEEAPPPTENLESLI